MNRRSLLGLFLTAPLGVCAAAPESLAGWPKPIVRGYVRNWRVLQQPIKVVWIDLRDGVTLCEISTANLDWADIDTIKNGGVT